MTDDQRSIRAEIEVPGTPDEVWRAIATGPGISSWYVPHTVEERTGGEMVASFGPGMEVAGRVAVWDPPHRVVFDGGDADVGLAFDWSVESCDGGTCVVRLVNSGFGSGADWDDQYDAMESGWALFMRNLRLHLERFPGREATAMLPMAQWPVPAAGAWQWLTQRLGVDADPAIGSSVRIDLPDGLGLAGTVADLGDNNVSLVLDEPAEGTAFITAEAAGGASAVSVWSYLYGDERDAVAGRDGGRWADWLEANAPPPE